MQQPLPLATHGASTSKLLSRARLLAVVAGGAAFGFLSVKVAGRTVKGWRYNTVESPVPAFDSTKYALTIDGLCENPFTLTYEQLRALPAVRQVSDFHCVEGWGVDDVQWDGVRLQTIIDRAKPSAKAKYITFHSMGGIYRDSLSLQQARLPDALIAYDMDGKPLPPDHGLPLRVIMPRMFGYKGAKWLRRIEFRDEQDIGYWEFRGWRVDAWIKA